MAYEYRYAELHCHSNFSFLDGVSSPVEIVERAVELDLPICALTDHNGLYGVVAFSSAAKGTPLRTVFGAELTLNSGRPRDNVEDPSGSHIVALAKGPKGYGQLSRLISEGHMANREKGSFVLTLDDLSRSNLDDIYFLSGCRKGAISQALYESGPSAALKEALRLREVLGRDNFAIECWDHGDPVDEVRNDELIKIADRAGLNVLATNNVHYARSTGARTFATVAAIRANRTLEEIEGWLPPSHLAYLRSPKEQYRRFRRYERLLENAYDIGDLCAFDLSLVAPKLPSFERPDGMSEASYLRQLTYDGALTRYGPRSNERIKGAYKQIEYELEIIERLGFEGYFLIVWDIVQFSKRSNIFCQGRGSAANSAVCYALGITNVDPVSLGLLFERFLSTERDGPPDIDVDFESEAREEVIQYVYNKYGRDKAAMVANVITYRSRSIVRDLGRVFGYPSSVLSKWSKSIDRYKSVSDLLEAKDRSGRPLVEIPSKMADIARSIDRAPRHLGIHTGGMVICDRPIVEVCPVEWARRSDRSVLQWDKDDCAIAGLVKFDLLGLGMLEALHRMVDLVKHFHGVEVDLALLEQDSDVYEMLAAADTVGVFQVESRAQMATLPRLRPRCFYDLVVEVALIRPGPIQGGSVHPYIRRRNGEEEVTYLHPLLEKSLKKTLGVPLFQEQLMQMAIDVGGFSPSDADQLRQAMGSKRSTERMERLRERFYVGMEKNGIVGDIADEIFSKLKAFANFGFPESHSASFAYLVYVSAWFKFYYPGAFVAAIIDSQPMGFWSPETLIEDAKRHGVGVLGPHVNFSKGETSLEPMEAEGDRELTLKADGYLWKIYENAKRGPHVRIGLSSIRKIGGELAQEIADKGPYGSIEELAIAVNIDKDQMESLAKAGALDSLPASGSTGGLNRRQAIWVSAPLAGRGREALPGMVLGDRAPSLEEPSTMEASYMDLEAYGITPKMHIVGYHRDYLTSIGAVAAKELKDARNRSFVRIAGVVTHRQRPATAKGVTFLSIEDESGLINVVVSIATWDKYRSVVRASSALVIDGQLEAKSNVINVVAKRIASLEIDIFSMSRDFR